MKPNSNGALLWNQRIAENTDETTTRVHITFVVPVVWMYALDKTTEGQRESLRSKIADSLYYRLVVNPEWDNSKYTLTETQVVDLHKDYIRVKVILSKKV